MKEDLEVLHETATIGALQLDFTGIPETNVAWTQANKEKMQTQLRAHLGSARVLCSSSPPLCHNENYQPGGTMLACAGPQTGRMMNNGSDPWGAILG